MSSPDIFIKVSEKLKAKLKIQESSEELDFYSFLGLSPEEKDPAKIEEAAFQRITELQAWVYSPLFVAEAGDLLQKVEFIRKTLANPETRKQYDKELSKYTKIKPETHEWKEDEDKPPSTGWGFTATQVPPAWSPQEPEPEITPEPEPIPRRTAGKKSFPKIIIFIAPIFILALLALGFLIVRYGSSLSLPENIKNKFFPTHANSHALTHANTNANTNADPLSHSNAYTYANPCSENRGI